ncbi:GIN domain-containing protein [Chitinimonas sp. BJB300]|uniref:GIN domain-containing protein n=1 Tax=Chitinimonas sp. BJB300 TaxID=1559339 RepID=UPI000C1111FC|nr:DUF2807 domain-containing protein [Chitinimonas sp. BJB300]PHV09644.1 hypothetical protein CSQ89_20570 [Chitinimonas sp. BJB300]TSJ82881.1 hypothetical protein FG002_021855 [Chitinimonas sp. BJB300]
MKPLKPHYRKTNWPEYSRKRHGEQFSIHTAGPGYISASGKVDKLCVQATGVGKLELESLKVRKATMSNEGLAHASLRNRGAGDIFNRRRLANLFRQTKSG